MIREQPVIHFAILGRNDGMWWPLKGGGLTFYCEKCGQPMGVPHEAILNDKLNPAVVCPEVPEELAYPTLECPGCKAIFHVTFAGYGLAARNPKEQK